MSTGAIQPLERARPAECLTAGVAAYGRPALFSGVRSGRRFLLCLVAAHYGRSGVAIFTEVTPEDDADGEPRHDIYQDVGTWCVDGGGDAPSVLKVDCMPSDNLGVEGGVAIMNALLEQIGSTWSDTFERWTP